MTVEDRDISPREKRKRSKLTKEELKALIERTLKIYDVTKEGLEELVNNSKNLSGVGPAKQILNKLAEIERESYIGKKLQELINWLQIYKDSVNQPLDEAIPKGMNLRSSNSRKNMSKRDWI